MLTWNALSYTQRCVASLLAHTDPRHELIFVDNGSSDGTPEWLTTLAEREPQRVRVHLNRANLGFAAGNNQGIALAQRDHVLLLNSDTVVTAGWLERLLAVLAREPRAGLVGPVSNSISGPQRLADGRLRPGRRSTAWRRSPPPGPPSARAAPATCSAPSASAC